MTTKISIVLPDLSGGGAERLHVYLAKDWVARGYSVELVLLRKQGALLPLVPPGIAVIGLGASRIRSSIFPLAAYLRDSRPDVILAAIWPLTSAAVIAWLLASKKGRVYLSEHSVLSVNRIRGFKVSQRFLETSIRLTYPLASGVVAVSQGVKNDLCRLGGLLSNQVRVIHNPAAIGVSPHRESQAVRDQLWGHGFHHHILSVGALKAEKDHETLIRAFAKLPLSVGAKLTILGEGALRSELLALMDQLGVEQRADLPGFVIDPYPWLRSADLFVLSSRCEGFGNVIVEALECGVPVVSTDCPSGPAEILERGRYGKLVPVRDPEALSAAMLQSLTEAHDREALMRRAQAFSISAISDQYLAYLFPQGR